MYERKPTLVRHVISEQTSATVRQILEQVVGDPVDGTGRNAAVAGRTIFFIAIRIKSLVIL